MRLRVLLALVAAIAGPGSVIGLAAGVAAAQTPGAVQTPFRPVAIVNDQVITGYDLAQRMQILAALGYPSTGADALRSEALDQLVDEKLKVQAARQAGIDVTPDMVQAGVEEYARRSGMTPDAFRALLSKRGVAKQAIDDMARAEIAWVQVVRARFANRIEPGDAEIDSELALQGNRGGAEYQILEIGLPLEDAGRSPAQTRALADQLYRSLSKGGDFRAAVARYSRAPSAARGGEVGWVSTERMPADLRAALGQLEVGQVSRPLPVSGGISILKLVDKRSADGQATADDQTRAAMRNQLVNQRSSRLADGLLQEMRRDALIEVR